MTSNLCRRPRRKPVLLAALAILLPGLVAPAGPALAAGSDLATPAGQLEALRRIQCSAKDGESVVYYWHGHAYSRVPGEPDRRLFRVEGMNIRQCGPLPDAKSPADFRLVSREILLYEHPDTHEVLRTWENPWTGKTVEVLHVANDPVNGSYSVVGRDGKPRSVDYSVLDGQWWLTMTVPLFYPNVLGGNYQPWVGGTYHAAELFNFFGDVADLENESLDSVPVRVAWQRMSQWLPWMEMGDRPGMFWVNTAGRKVRRWEDVSPTMRAEIEKNYPEYASPPPLDDRRPNETSWTYFKKHVDGRRSAGE